MSVLLGESGLPRLRPPLELFPVEPGEKAKFLPLSTWERFGLPLSLSKGLLLD